jgi:hypothetical protein
MQNADVFYGLTWHGTILTRDQLGMPFRHESLAGGSLAGRVPPNAARFTLHCTSAGPNIGVTGRLLPGVPAAEAPETADQPGFAVLPTGTGRAVFLHLGKNFLAAAQTCGRFMPPRRQASSRSSSWCRNRSLAICFSSGTING